MNSKLYCINPNTKEYEEVKTIYGIDIEEILDLIRDYKMSKDLKFDKFGKLEEIERLENENERYRIALNEMAIIISNAIEYLTDDGVCILNKGMKENEQLVWTWENYYDLLDILKGVDKE